MTAPYAKAVVTAELDWGNVGTEFEARVRVAAEKAAKAAQKQFDRIRLAAKVSFRADVVEFRRTTQERLNKASFSANVMLRADTSKFHADVRKATKNVPGAKVKVTPEVKNVQVFVQELEERLRGARITAPVFLAVANEADFLARIATLTRPVTQTVNIITTGDTGGDGGGSGARGRNGRLRGGMIRRIRMQIEMDRSSVASAEAQIAALETRLAGARTKQSESLDRVRVAQERLNEVNARADSTTSQRLAAQAALTRATNDHGTHTARVTQTIGDQADAHQRLRRAQENQNSTSRLVRAGIGGLAETAMNLGKNLLSSVSPAGLLKTALVALAALSLVPLLGQLAQAAGIISLLPAVAGAAVAGIATMVIGFTGVFDAFSKGSKAAEIAVKGTAAAAKQQEADARKRAQAAKAVASAERGVEKAIDGVERAERGVTTAQNQAEKAQKSLNQAREDAKTTIDDLNFALKGTAIDERDSVLALARAREAYDKTFADPAASALDRSEAALGVDKALRRQEEVGRRNTQLAKDAADANTKGIEGSDQVIAAKEAVVEADQGIVDANKGVVDAQEQVTLAQENLVDAQAAAAEAMSANADAIDEYADALANLSSNARRFVEQVRGLSDAWKELRLEIQEKLFDGLGDSIVNLAENYFPILRTGLGGIATEISGGLNRAIADLSSESTKLDWTQILENTRRAIGPVIDGLSDLFGALTDIAAIGSEFLPGFGESFAETMERFHTWTGSEEGQEKIRTFMEKSIESLKQVKDLFLAVGDVVGGLFATSEQTGKSMIESMTDSLREFAGWMRTADGQESMGRFWETVRETVTEILGAVSQGIILMDKVLALAAALGLVPDAPKPVTPLKDENGEPVRSPSGKVVPDTTLKDENGNPVFNSDGDPVPAPVEPGFIDASKGEGGGDEDRPGLNPSLPNGHISQPDVALPKPGPILDGSWIDPFAGQGVLGTTLGPDMPKWTTNWGSGLQRWITNDDNNGLWAGIKGIFGGDGVPDSRNEQYDGPVPTDGSRGSRAGGGGGTFGPATVTGPNVGGGRSGGTKDYTREEWEQLFGDVDEFDRRLEEIRLQAEETGRSGSASIGGFGTNVGTTLGGLVTGDFSRFGDGLSGISKNIFGTTEDGKTNWGGLGTRIGEVTGDITGRLFPGFKIGLGDVGSFALGVVEAFRGDWSRLKGIAAEPINWIIRNVINGALKNAWNAVAAVIPGLSKWDGVAEVATDDGGDKQFFGFASGGIAPTAGVMSGYSPGRDDRLIAVGGGEAVMRPEWTRAMGPAYVNSANAAARSGGVEGVKRFAGAYATGGIVQDEGSITTPIQQSMWDAVRTAFPNAVLTSGTRYADVGSGFDNHMGQRALDLGGPMSQIARWIYGMNNTQPVLELIHAPLDGWQNLKNGAPLNYGAGTDADHYDHVHWAMDSMVGSDGKVVSNDGGGIIGGIKDFFGSGVRAARNAAANVFQTAVDALGSTIPDFGGSLMGGLPKSMFEGVTSAMIAKVRGSTDGPGNTAFDVSAGAEQWRGMMIEAYKNQGYDPAPAKIDAWVRQIDTESGGDPDIAQQIVDVNGTGEDAGVGLGQMIPKTWQAYRDPTLPDNRRDPWAMTNAMVRYGEQKFGPSLLDVIGQGHGYDQGGIANGIGVMPKYTIKPERVLSPGMTPIFEDFVKVLERPDFIEILRQMPNNGATNAAAMAAAATSGPSTAFDPNNTGYDDTFYNDTVARGGKEGADAWLARQDFGPQIRTWGINAMKEIGGEFASPLGLEGRWGEAVDLGAKEYMRRQTFGENALKDRAAGGGTGGDTYNITQEFHGYNGTPQQFAAEVERMARQGMSMLTPV